MSSLYGAQGQGAGTDAPTEDSVPGASKQKAPYATPKLSHFGAIALVTGSNMGGSLFDANFSNASAQDMGMGMGMGGGMGM